MSTYKHPDGTVYKAAPGQEHKIIEMLRSEMLTDPGSNEKYMQRLTNLLGETFGVWINADTPKDFLNALVELKILDEIKE